MSIETLEYDVIGLGFGPANLAIAVALEEDARVSESGLRYCFLEKKPAFEWHGGMLLEDSRMQVSFIKDLATLRNPASAFTFINYLHQKRRLESFSNIGTFYPTRLEYNDYLGWAAGHFAERVHYGEEVIGVEALEEQGEVRRLRVLSRSADGRTRTRITRNLVVSIGGLPSVPEVFRPARDPRVIHSSTYQARIDDLCAQRDGRHRLAVIGSGQSAAEIFNDLAGRFPNSEVSLVMRGQALRPADDSPFVNEIFNPSYTDVIYQQPHAVRQALIRSHAHTNYSVVDLDLIERVYERLYLQQVTGKVQHQLLNNRQILGVQAQPEGIQLTLSAGDEGGGPDVRGFDAVVLATGYRRDGHKDLLEGVSQYFADAEVERSYRQPTLAHFQPNIFLQGCCEASHGLSDTLLSVLAVRSQEVVDALLLNRRRPQQAAACA
ncbi:MAG: lysine N(6)-hydroxylase/L-ornithine N(5)-oxygenase family protein [Pseudomonas sp.]|uniref:lysine N(6)-hydroxylase/L-ornithine N(5)-oxygenase family protein n=1 Tax=Pseudomonas sp. TaxID=306 RepID=UPI003399BD41